jgi:aminocarboxymuconate-semialdehyde decarboxylase
VSEHSGCGSWPRRPPRQPPRDLRELYFDTIVFTHHQLEYLAATWGSDHVLLGSDYPFDMAEPDPVRFVSTSRLAAADKAAILGGNAAKLLKIKVPRKK